jgi:hypothetical protein
MTSLLLEAEMKLPLTVRNAGYELACCVFCVFLYVVKRLCDRRSVMRKRKMDCLINLDSEGSCDLEASSPKRHASQSADDFVVDEDEVCCSQPREDALSFDDGSTGSYQYSSSSPKEKFVLPPYAESKAQADAEKSEGVTALHALLDLCCVRQMKNP